MNNNGNNISTLYSWPVIILFIFIFWPVGLFLIIKRSSLVKSTQNNEKKNTVRSGKVLKWLGIASFFMAAYELLFYILLAVITRNEFYGESVSVVVVFIVTGVILLYFASKRQKESEIFNKYLSIIVNGGERHLDAIASAIGKPYDTVKKDIQNMIEKGFLESMYINEHARELVFAHKTETTSAEEQARSKPAFHSGRRVVACPCCGANNTVVGSFGECEYCGTPLK